MHVVVGPGDQPEHLHLGFHGRPVVGQHVHPVVLGQERRRRAGRPREREPAAPGTSPTPCGRGGRGQGLEGAQRAASAGSATETSQASCSTREECNAAEASCPFHVPS